METVGQRIKRLRLGKKLSARALGEMVQMSQSGISEIEQDRSKRPGKLPEIAKALGTTVEYILGETLIDVSKLQSDPQDITQSQSVLFDHTAMLPILAAVEGGEGVLIVDTDPIDYTVRPRELTHVPDAFGVVVVGESMLPSFKPGDRAAVHPRIQPAPGDDCIVYGEDAAGNFRASIKEFVRATPTHWIVCQHNPRRELSFPRSEWQKVMKVVANLKR